MRSAVLFCCFLGLLVGRGWSLDCSSAFEGTFPIPVSCWVGTDLASGCDGQSCPLQITYAPPTYTPKLYEECFGAGEGIACYNQRITCVVPVGALEAFLEGREGSVGLFAYLPGTGVDPSGQATFLLQLMMQPLANENNVASCIFEYPDWNFNDEGLAGIPSDVVPSYLYPGGTGPEPGSLDPPGLYIWKAQQLFGGYQNPPAPTISALDIACRLSFLNCDSVAVGGNSQGSYIGISSASLDSRVSTHLLLAGAPIASWPDYYPNGEFQVSWKKENVGLPLEKRLLITGEMDTEWIDTYCNGVLGNSLEECEGLLKQPSGYYQVDGNSYSMTPYFCGANLKCTTGDGSGYYILPNRTHYQTLDYYGGTFTTRYTIPAFQWVIQCSKGNCYDWTVGLPDTGTLPPLTPIENDDSDSGVGRVGVSLVVVVLCVVFLFGF